MIYLHPMLYYLDALTFINWFECWCLVIKLNLFLFLLTTFIYSWSSAIFCLWAACNFKWWSLGCSFHWISSGMQSRIGSGISSSTNCQSTETKKCQICNKILCNGFYFLYMIFCMTLNFMKWIIFFVYDILFSIMRH